MLIKFNLQGVERVIKLDNNGCYTAYAPGTDRALGYYASLQNAVLKHIRHASVLDSTENEEVIELKDLVLRYQKLLDEVRGLSQEDISKFAVFEETGKTTRVMSEETKAKIRAARSSNKTEEKEPDIEKTVEEDDDDL